MKITRESRIGSHEANQYLSKYPNDKPEEAIKKILAFRHENHLKSIAIEVWDDAKALAKEAEKLYGVKSSKILADLSDAAENESGCNPPLDYITAALLMEE